MTAILKKLAFLDQLKFLMKQFRERPIIFMTTPSRTALILR